jgi:uncharacterized Zn finger protein
MKVKIYAEQSRNYKAQSILIKRLSQHDWICSSIEGKRNYSVKYQTDKAKLECECGDFVHRGNVCKHIIAVISTYCKNFELVVS